MNTFKHKVLSLIIPVLSAYLGFKALDYSLKIYQLETYFVLAWYVFAFHVFWLAFIFDLHLKGLGKLNSIESDVKSLRILGKSIMGRARHFFHWNHVRHFFNYLILPAVIYWSTIILLFLNVFQEGEKDAIIIFSTAALGVAYWYFKDAFTHISEVRHTGLKVLSVVKLFAAYLSLTAMMGFGWYYGLALNLVLPLVYLVVFVLIYQALVQHKLLRLRNVLGIFMISVLVSLVFGVVYLNWDINYYTAGLLVGAVYNTAWGLFHKYADSELTAKIFLEYSFMLVLLVSVIISTHSFNGRI